MGKKAKAMRTAGEAAGKKAQVSAWGRSKCTKSDLNKLHKYGLLSAKMEAKLTGDKVESCLDEGWRVMFFHFMLHGISLSAHEFLRGLLLVYGVQLHSSRLIPLSISPALSPAGFIEAIVFGLLKLIEYCHP
jgi:hypothetical protein